VPSSNGKEEIAQKKKNKKKEYEIWVPQTKGNYSNAPCKFGDIDGIVTWEEREDKEFHEMGDKVTKFLIWVTVQ